MADEIIYQAFILYPDAKPEKEIAANLAREIEKFKIPRKVVTRLAVKDLKKIYLFGAPVEKFETRIEDKIEEALSRSRFLIVVCSPRAVAAKMMNAIIKRFMRLGKRDQILTLLVEGTPEKSFPEVLLEKGKRTGNEAGNLTEPLAANICAKDVDTSLKRLKELEKYRIIAPLLGCELYDLKQIHLAWNRRNSMIKTAALALVISLAGFFYLTRALVVQAESDRLKIYQELNEDIIFKMYETLPEKLKDVPGAQVMLDEVIWNRADIRRLVEERQKTAVNKKDRGATIIDGMGVSKDRLNQIARQFQKFEKLDFDPLKNWIGDTRLAEWMDDAGVWRFWTGQRKLARFVEPNPGLYPNNSEAAPLRERLEHLGLRFFLTGQERLIRESGAIRWSSTESRAISKIAENQSFREALPKLLRRLGQWLKENAPKLEKEIRSIR
jgi:hypothetical protein